MATTPNGEASAPDSVTESAWANVRVEVEPILPLPMDTASGRIEVHIVNDSPVTLRCDGEEPLGLHCQFFDFNGRFIANGPPDNALTALLAPGTCHRETLEVRIPADINQEVASLRVYLGRADGSWVAKLHRNHAKTVVLDRGISLSRLHDVMLQGAGVWPLGRSNGLRWPSSAMMVSQRHKLLYIPVAKCACTSLKSAMLELAGIEQYEKAVELGVHLVTDRFNTGVQLKDLPMKQAWEILASQDYFKFMVIREPFERLVSAYLEKFVYNRHNERNLLHTREVLARAQGTTGVDVQQGISFDQFLTVLLGCEEGELDPHWRPQYLYRRTVKHRINLYRLENIDRLGEALEDITGQPLRLEHRNKTARSSELVHGVSALPAAEVERLGSLDPHSFAGSSLRGDIERYYQQDLELYRSAS